MEILAKIIIKKERITKRKPKKRILGHAKGKIWESPDCWNDDFDDEKS